MREFRMRAFFGILGLAGAGFMISSVSSVGGCSSSGGSTGTAGSSSTGTAGSSGTAGTTGNGGNSSGGSGGSGGASGPAAGCMASALAPGDTGNGPYTIADFTAVDGGASYPIGGTFTYASPDGAVAPTPTVANGGWHVTLSAPGMASAPQYIGFGIYFNGNTAGDECVDATPHMGVKFDISGMVTGCTVQFSTNDSAHADSTVTGADKKAGGPKGAYAPQAAVTVTSTVATVMVPFTGGTLGTGSPATDIDKSKLTGVQWQFTVATGTATCVADIVIDNVAFY
jgi:hypothetical protein